ncbi:MAG: hypothetical protein NT080_07500 [Spirochaetes bacterium]|nr:hypothetical protein [Spirochaetota bacterium]
MTKNFRITAFLLSAVLFSVLPAVPAAAQAKPAVAFVGVSNAGGDPRYDYLSGILLGIVSFDLSSEVVLVDRRNLESVISEQELSLTGIAADGAAASKIGKLLNADWILTGDFVALGTEVLFTLTLVDVATSRASVFRDRGSDENVAHRAAEQLVLKLTGRTVKFSDAAARRSILSMRDETPGSIALFSPIIDAEIHVDGEFTGYTTGDAKKPFEIAGLRPGKHRVRVHISREFGVLKLPEITFSDWDVEVDIQGGKRVTLRDETRHFSEQLWRVIELANVDLKAPFTDIEGLRLTREIGYVDRGGIKVPVLIELTSMNTVTGLRLELTLKVGGETKAAKLDCPPEAGRLERAATLAAGNVSVELKLYCEGDLKRWRVTLDAIRTDVSMDEWKK